MCLIKLKNISTSYCLKNINIDIEFGEFVVIMGFTGAGKSTLLNVISGLVEYQGEVYFNGKNINNVPTEKRNVGYLLQDIYLFPHMNVFDNIAFGLRANNYPAYIINQKVEEIMELLHISHLKERYPKNLSGGEKRWVGLARSLIMEPKILLLDEPLSGLDPFAAKKIRKELKQIQKKLNLTIIYVTHNFIEAKELADRVIVMANGELKQFGSIEDVFSQPVDDIRELVAASSFV